MYRRLLVPAFTFIMLTASALCSFGETTGFRVDREGYRLVAETERLELYFRDEDQTIALHDRLGDTTWYSVPDLSASEDLPDLLVQTLVSPIRITYTDGQREDVYEALIGSKELTSSVVPLEDGIAVDYLLSSKIVMEERGFVLFAGEIGFRIQYRLEDSDFVVSVPEEHMTQDGTIYLVGIHVLPYFGANSATEDGALVLPLGAGAEIEYKVRSPNHVAAFFLPVFGEDEYDFSSKRQLTTSLLPSELEEYVKTFEVPPDPLTMPLFGIRHGDSTLLGIVEKGAADSKLIVGQRGFVVDFNRTAVEFVYRKIFTTYMSRTRQVISYETTQIPGDRSIRYTVLYDEDSTIIGMARAYRAHLQSGNGLNSADSPPLMNIRVFCGIEKAGFLSREFVAATRFDEVSEIINTLKDNGIEDFGITLVGWGNNGYYGAAPQSFPPERKLGGRRGLRELVEYAHSQGVPVYLDLDYMIAIQGHDGFNRRRDVIKEVMDIPRTDGHGTYLLNPRFTLERIVRPDIERLVSYGVDGVVVNNLADVLLSDHDEANLLQRGEALRVVQQIFQELSDAGLDVQVTGKNSYAFPFISGIQQVAPFGDMYFGARKEVPLLFAVLHGRIPYYTQPLNLSEDRTRDILRMIEFGMRPSFELTFRDPVILRATAYNLLYSAQYENWAESIKSTYDTAAAVLEATRGAEITGYEVLSEDVTTVRYDNGIRIYVNKSNEPVIHDDLTVAARSYLLTKEGVPLR